MRLQVHRRRRARGDAEKELRRVSAHPEQFLSCFSREVQTTKLRYFYNPTKATSPLVPLRPASQLVSTLRLPQHGMSDTSDVLERIFHHLDAEVQPRVLAALVGNIRAGIAEVKEKEDEIAAGLVRASS